MHWNKIEMKYVYCSENHKWVLKKGENEMDSIRKSVYVIAIVLLALGVAGCGKSTETDSGLANPASVYCEGLGYELDLQTSMCTFPDGSECNEWDFLAGRCGQEHSYCAQQGFVLEAEEESNIGKCVFSDGSSCMEIDYFEGRCKPGGK
jgi:putative hemolysin